MRGPVQSELARFSARARSRPAASAIRPYPAPGLALSPCSQEPGYDEADDRRARGDCHPRANVAFPAGRRDCLSIDRLLGRPGKLGVVPVVAGALEIEVQTKAIQRGLARACQCEFARGRMADIVEIKRLAVTQPRQYTGIAKRSLSRIVTVRSTPSMTNSMGWYSTHENR